VSPDVFRCSEKVKLMSLKQQTISGIAWSTVARIAQQALGFIISVILARLLMPEDFGLIAMIAVFTGFARLFSDMGFAAALIQRSEITERHLSSIFWLNVMSGLALTGIMIALASYIAKFYAEPILKSLIMVISATFFIGSLNTVQTAILKRSMDFRKLALIETLAMAIAGSWAIILAFMGLGVWSLAWQTLISTTLTVILMWHISNWRPSTIFDKSAIKDLFHYSSNLLGFGVFNYWVRNGDDLLIGKFIGSAGLGIYARAYNIMLMPLTHISATVGQVMFSSLSKLQEDKERVKHVYLRSISIIALITFPMMIGLLVVADSFVLALLGQKWAAVIPLLQIFCLLGLAQSIGTTVGWIYNSQGRTDWQFRWGMVAGSLLILSIVIGIIIGTVISVAGCYAIMSGIILTYHNFAIPGKLINMTFRDVVRSVSGIFGCAVLMSGCVYLLGMFLPSEWPHWARLLALVPSGIALYFALIHSFKLKAYLDVKKLVREQLAIHSIGKSPHT
jgi:O-antigen/teichoic acid export membrane protein